MKTLAFLLVLLPTFGLAQTHPGLGAKAAIMHRYAEITQDFKSHNSKDYASTIANDFQLSGLYKADKSQTVQGFAHQSLVMSNVTWTRKIDKIILHGNNAIVTQTGHLDGHTGGSRSIHIIATSVDTWVKEKGKWILKSSKVLSMQMKTWVKENGKWVLKSKRVLTPRVKSH